MDNKLSVGIIRLSLGSLSTHHLVELCNHGQAIDQTTDKGYNESLREPNIRASHVFPLKLIRRWFNIPERLLLRSTFHD